MAGFAPQTQTGIMPRSRPDAELEFTLGVEGVAEQVTVESTAPLLQTTNAEISDVIENREVVADPAQRPELSSLWRS